MKKRKEPEKKICDQKEFDEAVLTPYLAGEDESLVEADEMAARSLMPPSTANRRSFASVGSEIPRFTAESCVGCMECVITCPDVAIHTRTVSDGELDSALKKAEGEGFKKDFCTHFVKTTKHNKLFEKQGKEPGQFSLWIDPDRCKSCGECVAVCGDHNALTMVPKTPELLETYRKATQFVRKNLSDSPSYYMNDRLEVDSFMDESLRINQGGSGACMGCGEVTAINMALTATASISGKDMAIVAATGCNTVYSSTYPFNIFNVPWTSSLFENAPAVAIGLRMRLDQNGKEGTKLWVFGGDGAMFDIGFQSLSRLLTSNLDVNVLVLDTQVYSNTGGQASTATYLGQNAKMSAHGKVLHGKPDRRKELGLIAMQHPDVFVAQVSQSHINHFMKAVKAAVDYPGPSLVIAYSACIPEHGIADSAAQEQAKRAVTSRAFPIFVYDPRKGESFKERLSLQGNPAFREDWSVDKKTEEMQDFVWFAKTEGRFSKLFDKEGNPSETLLLSQDDRLKHWRSLQELAGIRE